MGKALAAIILVASGIAHAQTGAAAYPTKPVKLVVGFAAGGPERPLAHAFLRTMSDLIGPDKIAAWGTEQVASNFLIANDTAPVVLPYVRYLNYWGEPWEQDAAFVHFVGTHRHANGAYLDASRQVIDQLHHR